MDKRLDKLLVESFPILYGNRNKSVTQSCMGWGFDVDDGWFLIIWELSKRLEEINNTELKEAEFKIVANQVKEKFATLRFYTSYATEDAYYLIHEAEALTAITCETCGQPGDRTGKHWIKTLCQSHAEEWNASKTK